MKNCLSKLPLALLTLLVSACLFDSEDESKAVSEWLSDHGMPESYAVKLLSVSNVPVLSTETYRNIRPTTGYYFTNFGASAGLTHDAYIDFAFNFTKGDTELIATFQEDDSASVELRLFPLEDFYEADALADSVPFTETDLTVTISYRLDEYSKKSSLDSVVDLADSTWYDSIPEFNPDYTYDSTYTFSVQADSAVYFAMPDSFVTALQNVEYGGRIQLQISAPDAERVYRFSGYGSTSYLPAFRLVTGDSVMLLTPFRSANYITGADEYGDNVIFGGTRDSLIFRLDGSVVLEALEEFYGDEFPLTTGNTMDVRQAVVLAEITMPTDDDANGFSELGMPIQVVAYSFTDVDTDDEARNSESYKLNTEGIQESGHPNMLFYDQDSISLQYTDAFRDYINRATELDNIKLMLRLGYPVLEPTDTVYADYVNSDGDTIYFFFDYFDYARYDFTSSLENGVDLKLWLASKRSDEEDDE